MQRRTLMAIDVGSSFENGLDTLFEFLPKLLAFLVLILIGWIVAKIVQAALRKVLQKAGLDRQLHDSDANQYVERVMPGGASPSNGVATVAFWLVFAFFAFSAISALQVPALTTFMNQVLSYLPNIIVAIVIFVIAAAISGAVAAGIARVMGDTPTGKIAATVLPALVMVIALFMILEQLQIAPEIVRIAFAATMGALALGLALAFGLGGRSVAQRMLEGAYATGQRNKDQIKSDMQTGRDRAQSQAQSAQNRVEGDSSTGRDSWSETHQQAPGSTTGTHR